MNIQIPTIVFTIQNLVSVGTAVRWQRETNPVMFGHNVTLTCIVGRKEGCNKTATRRWDAGPDRNTLVINGHSTISSKYYEKAEDPCKSFSIVIMQFDLNDVNREYWCSFGFETSRQMLILDDRHFIDNESIHISCQHTDDGYLTDDTIANKISSGIDPCVPKNTSALMTLKQNEKVELDLKISFNKVYPKPTCKIKIGGEQWLDETLVSNPMGIFFNSRLHYTTTIERNRCKDSFISICRVLNYTILNLNKRLNCTYTVQNKDSTVLNTEYVITHVTAVSIAVIMILVVFVFTIILILIKQKGYIKSISEQLLGYPGNTRHEVRWNVRNGVRSEVPFDETDETIRFTFQQEHLS